MKSKRERGMKMSLTLTKEETREMIQLLKERNFKQAYERVTASNWWADDTLTNDTERENFLYKLYFAYYHLLLLEGVAGIEVKDAYLMLRHLKNQLDNELANVSKGIYEVKEI